MIRSANAYKTSITSTMTEREAGIGGRRAIPVDYIDVDFNGSSYTIGIITKLDGTRVPFIIDREDKEKVVARNWHCAVGGAYIASVFRTTEDETKALYLHNLVMNRLTFDGKGATESVDHINGIGMDNRKVNLRICAQSQQNRNTRTRARTTDKLPAGILPEEIPRNVWYIPSDGHHGDRFAVEIKGIPGSEDIMWRTTSSAKVTTREKLNLAVAKRTEFFASNAALRDYERASELSAALLAEYEAILALIPA